jgi:hypothetical protein
MLIGREWLQKLEPKWKFNLLPAAKFSKSQENSQKSSSKQSQITSQKLSKVPINVEKHNRKSYIVGETQQFSALKNRTFGGFFENEKVLVKKEGKFVPSRILKEIGRNKFLVNINNRVKVVNQHQLETSFLEENKHPKSFIIPETHRHSKH